MSNQFNLFEQAGITDVLSRDIVLARGQFVELSDSRFVRIDDNGVLLMDKSQTTPNHVDTYKELISPLAIMPVSVLSYLGESYIRLVFSTIDRRNNECVVQVQGLVNANLAVRKFLSAEGFCIPDKQWPRLAKVMQRILKQSNDDGTLHIEEVRPRYWRRDGVCLVPRAKALDLRIITGGKQSQAA